MRGRNPEYRGAVQKKKKVRESGVKGERRNDPRGNPKKKNELMNPVRKR